MDLTKAQRLLIKIQTFLDQGNGHELSRLEKDLLKTYIQQLYDTVITDQPEKTLIHSDRYDAPEVHKEKPYVPRQEEDVVEIKIPEPKPVHIPPPPPVYEAPIIREKETIKVPEPKIIDRFEPITVQEPVKTAVTPPRTEPVSPEGIAALAKLFELPKSDDVSERFSHIPIANIESALGLNERIFTLNELFGGNRGLFEDTCATLNQLSSYSEASAMLLNGPARHFNWADPERIRMAEHFIRIVARRYPKP